MKKKKEFPFILVRGTMAWLTEKHLKGDTKIAGTAGDSDSALCLLIKREEAVFLSVSVIPLFLGVLMFYSGET